MGCLVLMTVVVVAILVNTRSSQKRKALHYVPTQMTYNPLQPPPPPFPV
jgi:hypothetical protein